MSELKSSIDADDFHKYKLFYKFYDAGGCRTPEEETIDIIHARELSYNINSNKLKGDPVEVNELRIFPRESSPEEINAKLRAKQENAVAALRGAFGAVSRPIKLKAEHKVVYDALVANLLKKSKEYKFFVNGDVFSVFLGSKYVKLHIKETTLTVTVPGQGCTSEDVADPKWNINNTAKYISEKIK